MEETKQTEESVSAPMAYVEEELPTQTAPVEVEPVITDVETEPVVEVAPEEVKAETAE